ncbi:MAG: hypothetical protein U0075_10155 [Thermomicrobiales bacterium]
MVFQSFNLFPHMTVLERGNITLAPCKTRGVSRQRAEREARELLDRFRLADKAAERQAAGSHHPCPRHGPQVPLLLDEVTSALDPEMVE